MNKYTYNVVLTRNNGNSDVLGSITLEHQEYGLDLSEQALDKVYEAVTYRGPFMRWSGKSWRTDDTQSLTCVLASMGRA